MSNGNEHYEIYIQIICDTYSTLKSVSHAIKSKISLSLIIALFQS